MVSTKLDAKWDNYVRESKTSTPFLLSTYVVALDGNFRAYYCLKGNEIIAGLLIAVDDSGCNVVGHELMVHDGLFYVNFSALNQSQTLSEEHKISQFIAEFLAGNYKSITLSFSPKIVDIRAFQWVNYHNNLPKYSESIRYTSYVNIAEFADESIDFKDYKLYKNASVSRRQEIRYGYAKNVVVEYTDSIEEFLYLYEKTFERQNIILQQNLLPQMKVLLSNLHASGDIKIYTAKNENGNVGSIAIFLLLNDTAYYLFGANDYSLRAEHTGTAVLWRAFKFLSKLGVTTIDLEGVNSPERGWFKLSFGGAIVPYFNVNYVD